jgi:hypothetical protein
MLDPQVREGILSLLGDGDVVGYEDTVQLLRMIMPPAYLQEQVEGAVARSTDYLKQEADTLELYVDLGPPLSRIKPVLFEYLDQRIDTLQEDTAAPPACTPERIQEVAGRLLDLYQELRGGKLPRSVVSLEALGEPCRGPLFEAAFRALLTDASLDQRAKQAFRERQQELRDSFLAGDTHGLLKQVARALAAPLMEDAIVRVRKDLDDQSRLDIISTIAAWHGQITPGEVRDAVSDFRDRINGFPFFRHPTLALAVVLGGALLMGLVHLPRLAAAVRWPGLTLLLTGGICYAAAKVAQATLPSRLADLLAGGAAPVPPIPPSALDLGGDILQSLSQQIFTGLAGPSLILFILGAVLFASSFFVSFVRPTMDTGR